MNGIQLGLPALAAIIGAALVFDFINGLHDAANSIATVVSTRVLPPKVAVVWAAAFNFIAFLFFGAHVATTIGTGIIQPSAMDPLVVVTALFGAVVWNLFTWWLGFPSSSSHALIGGIAGAGVAKAGLAVIVADGFIKTSVAIVVSPLVGFGLALVVILASSWLLRRSAPYAVDRSFRRLQLISAALYSLGHGGNDAQKTMGIIAVLLFSQGLLGSHFYVPMWVVLSAHLAIGLGTLSGVRQPRRRWRSAARPEARPRSARDGSRCPSRRQRHGAHRPRAPGEARGRRCGAAGRAQPEQ